MFPPRRFCSAAAHETAFSVNVMLATGGLTDVQCGRNDRFNEEESNHCSITMSMMTEAHMGFVPMPAESS